MALKVLERYEVVFELGRWELGSVYKAIDTSNQRLVAIRELRRDIPPETVRTVVAAAREATNLDSPNIARVLEIGDSDGFVFVVMELVEGVTLRSLLQRQTRFSTFDLTDLTRQVCSALDHAYSRGMVHTNLHPANIVQEWDGNIKLLDYGVAANVLARVQGTQIPEALPYLSPEQARGEVADLRSNLFSWGAIFYEMLLGEQAFTGGDAAEVVNRILTASPAAHEQTIRAQPHLMPVVLKALSKLPEDRFQSGSAFAQALEACDKPAPTVIAKAPVMPEPTASRVAPEPPPTLRVKASSAAVDAPPSFATPVPSAAPLIAVAPQQVAQTSGTEGTSLLGATAVSSTPPARAAAEPTPAFIVVPSRMNGAAPKVAPAKDKKEINLEQLIQHKGFLFGLAALALLLICVLSVQAIHAVRTWRHEHPVVAETTAPPSAEAPTTAGTSEPASGVQETVTAVTSARARSRKEKAKPILPPPAPLEGELLIDSSPQGAQIQVNGSNLGFATPYTLSKLSAGQYAVTVTKAGYSPEARSVQVKGGDKLSLVLPLTELLATVAITSEPGGASVILDGKDTGKLTPVSVAVHKGSHTVTVTKSGYFEVSNNMVLIPGQTHQFAPRLIAMGAAGEVKPLGKLKSMFGGGSAAMARVQIRTNPKGAQISVNQRTMDKVTPAEFLFPGGVYEITLTAPGYKPVRKTIDVVGGAKLVVDEPMQKGGM